MSPIELRPEEAVPEEMVPVNASSGSDAYGLFAPGLEQAPNVSLGEFLIDKLEVTNREYAEFVEAGGYADMILVDGNPLEDIGVIGGNTKWFDADPEWKPIETIRVIMLNGAIYKNTLE